MEMNTYEYSVEPSNIDGKGMVTVQSFCRDIINALWRSTQKDESPMTLTSSSFEIDERPRLDDNFNVTITKDEEGTSRLITVTDYNGSEIGRGRTTWRKEAAGKRPTEGLDESNRFIKAFCKLVPEGILSSGLAVRLDMNFNGDVERGERIDFGIERKNDENYLFKAFCGSKTICSASLMTE